MGLWHLKSEILMMKMKEMQMIVPCGVVSRELEAERGWTYMMMMMMMMMDSQ